jgi:hypothetical protein
LFQHLAYVGPFVISVTSCSKFCPDRPCGFAPRKKLFLRRANPIQNRTQMHLNQPVNPCVQKVNNPKANPIFRDENVSSAPWRQIKPIVMSCPGRIWTAVAERSGDTAFPDAYPPPNVTCYPKAPSPADDRHRSRSAGALQNAPLPPLPPVQISASIRVNCQRQ